MHSDYPQIKKQLNKEGANMANLIGIAGNPASGKTSSLRTLPPDQTVYIDCDGKGLNWKNWREQYNREKNNYCKLNEPEKVIRCVQHIATSEKYNQVKFIVVDTVNNLMVSEEMRRCKEKGYDKWTDLAQYIWQLVEMPGMLRDDLTVILVFHTQTEHTDDGYEYIRIKTNGRKTEKNDIDSKFNWLLRSVKQGDKYMLEVTSHNSTSRTPLDAFEEEYIPNDIMRVIAAMQEF